MKIDTRHIELASSTAERLQASAEAEDLPLSDFVEVLLDSRCGSVTLSPEELAELDAQIERINAGEPTVPHEEVAAWLATWGTPDYRPWSER